MDANGDASQVVGGAQARISLALAVQSSLLRAGLIHILASMPECEVGAVLLSTELLYQDVLQQQPDLLVLDSSMPDVQRTLSLLKQSRTLRVIVVLNKSEHIWDLLAGKADAYCHRDDSEEELRGAVRAVIQGRAYLSCLVTEYLLRGSERSPLHVLQPRGQGNAALATLTPREQQVLHLLAEGKTTFEIASSLCVSAQTVKVHVKHVMRKLNARRRQEAVMKLLHG